MSAPKSPPAESRLRRALVALPLLALAALMARTFSMVEPIGPILHEMVENSLFTASGGVEVPVIKAFYGFPALDNIFEVITVAFAQLQFFTNHEAYWQSLVFLTDFAGMYAVILVESYRPGNTFPAIRFPIVFFFLSQVIAVGFLSPLFFFTFYVLTPAYKLTTPSLHRPGLAPCFAIIPTILLSYHALHFPSYFHPSLEARNWWNWLWQLFPVWGSATMFVLSKILSRSDRSSPGASNNELNVLRAAVSSFSLISTATWWYTLPRMEGSIPDIFIPQYLASSPQDPYLGLRTLIQYDYLCTFAAGFLWLAYHFKDLENVGICNISWVRVIAVSLVLGLILGPGTLFVLVWLLREELLAAARTDKTESKD
ncbi:hypothetical protein F66182_1326 [Fusarium sp. NRRL 66182]|nr:hypothetical protein F66182_1326 [Fusarium sp. NRRL 66182]